VVGRGDDGLSAAAYAARLLEGLDARPPRAPTFRDEHPACAWARSGAMALTGRADADPRMCPVPLAAAADGVLALVDAFSLRRLPPDLEGAGLLGERAAIAGLARAGATSCGGACRLLRLGSGDWIAINLARPDDFELLPAWLECDGVAGWTGLARAVERRSDAEALVSRGRELGLAVAAMDERHPAAARGFREIATGPAGRSHARERPRVLDLTALWAGPLCGHLLLLGGADVVKVEGRARPDGARSGPPAFFDLLNAGKRCVALDLGAPHERAWLAALVDDADIVIEASRPRALRQLGIDAESRVRARAGLTWIALSGHGRDDQTRANWIAYGDDAAVDAGLARVMHAATGEPMFVGDAIADPLAGLHAALLAWWSWHRGGSRLLAVSLSECVRHVVEWMPADDWRARSVGWEAHRRRANVPVAAPRARVARDTARALGADTAAVLATLDLPAC
jgi:crotonobetainyl-CoA:carnitine CoA-transferase CaiB-like acyl-CoA transferase